MEVTTTTTSVLARRAAKYLSKYCAEHKGCVNCAFANRSNSTCEINIAKFPSLWKFTPLWSDADVALAKAMMSYATQDISKANWYCDKFRALDGDDELLNIVPDNIKEAMRYES